MHRRKNAGVNRLVILFNRLLALVVLVAASSVAIADEWADLRVGMADSGFTASLQLNHADANELYAAILRGGAYLYDGDYRELSFAYGRRYELPNSAATLQAGIGVFEVYDRDDGLKRQVELGIPVSANYVFGKYLGLSAQVYMNVSRLDPLIGFELGMTLGKFR